MMLTLIPEPVNFKISTTDVLVKYSERNESHLELDVLQIENYIDRKKYTPLNIFFNNVAELKCCSLNFYEVFHGEFEVFNVDENEDELKFWKENEYHPDSGFYQVNKSKWLKESKDKYDPLNNLDLKHYLIIGNDSYVEVLAKGYRVSST